MYFFALFFTLLLASVESKGKELDPGPQAIKEAAVPQLNSTVATAPKSHKRYATKEVILYLTPSQIKALESGKGLVSPQTLPQPKEKQQQNSPLAYNEHEEFVKQQFENIKSAKIQEPQYQNLESVSQILSYDNQQNLENLQKNLEIFDIWKQQQEKAEEQAKLQYSYSQLGINEPINQWNVPKEGKSETELNDWLSHGSVSEKNQQEKLLHEQLKHHWAPVFKSNPEIKELSYFTPERQVSIQTEKPLLQSQYAPVYNDQKKAIEIEKLLRQHHRQELEKQSALTQAEAIANAPPILVHQEIKITKHHPVPVVKHVKVSVPTPILVPVPEPYEVKVPHPYPVPLEIIKPIPVPIFQTEKIEVEKPVPYTVERHIPVPVTKKVFVNVDRPYVVEKLVPVEVKKEVPVEIPIHKAEKITILRHVWNH